MRIDTITLYRFSLPLIRPFHLALGTIEAFDTIVAVAEDGNGGLGFGEATILTGYTAETIGECWPVAQDLARRIAGMETMDAKDMIQVAHSPWPFTATALMTSVEMLEGHPLLGLAEPRTVPLLANIFSTEDDAIAEEVEARLDEGYGTLKVKIGFDVDADLRRVGFIQDRVSGRARIRLDGNQGYDTEGAVHFATALKPDGIELLEQPCQAGDWEAAAAVARASNVPMMLDESIFGPADIERAAELDAARYIKLKLMKAGGLDSLVQGLKLIRDLGMTPVLGNGVASDVGCWMEACVARDHIDNAGEMNGFLKPRDGIFAEPMEMENGALVLDAAVPKLKDPDALAAMAAETACFPAASGEA